MRALRFGIGISPIAYSPAGDSRYTFSFELGTV